MKTTIISALMVLGFILMIAEPNGGNFFEKFFLIKILALLFFYAGLWLYQHWSKKGCINNLKRFLDDD